ncbi:hypothetical protein EWM64_g7703 [Hericium alpestre]|uniref:Uncharacterized protein n=1 Tax=Hericium alpestre TaxID=135208 RepID=A0A4Y9ZR57_9AGAM|nr:hypothetical protein EWM64_g7703 [Hericium alpestre]
MLLPVELKRHGVIRKVILEEIALHQYELSGLNSTNIRTSADAARLKMTVAILQQAIRYGDHYGARFVMASTYYDSFILDLASDGEDVGSAARRIRWSFVDHEHIKLAVAYLFWRACSKIQKKLADVLVAIGMGQGKKK